MTGIFQMEGYQTVNLHFFIRQNRIVELLVLQRPIHDVLFDAESGERMGEGQLLCS